MDLENEKKEIVLYFVQHDEACMTMVAYKTLDNV